MMKHERLFTNDDLVAAILGFLEFRNVHGYDVERAKFAAINEVCEGYDAFVYMHDHPLESEDLSANPLPDGEAVQRRIEQLEHERKAVKGHLEAIRDYHMNPDGGVNAGDMTDYEKLSGAAGQALAALDYFTTEITSTPVEATSITVGLIDTILDCARRLQPRDKEYPVVQDALVALWGDTNMDELLLEADNAEAFLRERLASES